jgi:DNA-3-methyladenine glycosylase II
VAETFGCVHIFLSFAVEMSYGSLFYTPKRHQPTVGKPAIYADTRLIKSEELDMSLHTHDGTLTATAPFDFNQSLKFLGIFTPIAGEQSVTNQTLTKAIRIEGQTIAFRVQSDGNIDQPDLRYTLFSDTPITTEIAATLHDRIAFFLSLEDDLIPFYALAADDPVFMPVVKILYGYHQVKFLTPFESACWAMLSTRNRMSIARVMKNRMVALFGSSIEVEGTTYPAFPEPADILNVAPGELAAVVGPMRRAEYIIEVARAFLAADENWLRSGDYEDVQTWLRGIKGIGPWSASLLMIRALGRMNRLVAPEKNLVKAASLQYGQPLNEEDVLKLAAPYSDYQAYWAHYLRAAS